MTSWRKIIVAICTVTIVAGSVVGLFAADDWLLTLPILANAVLIIVAVYVAHFGSDRSSVFGALDPFLIITYVHGCLVPLTDLVLGAPDLGFRGHSSFESALRAAGSSLLFTVCVLLGWSVLRLPAGRVRSAADAFPVRFAWLLIGLGAVGVSIRGPQAIAGLSGDLQASSDVDGILGVIGTFSTPLLPVGTFLLLAARAKTGGRRLLLSIILVPVSGLALSSYSLNRAAIIIPIIAMVITWATLNGNRKFAKRLLAVGLASSVLFVVIGQAREAMHLRSAGIQSDQSQGSVEFALSNARVYGESFYLVGIVYEQGSSEGYSIDSLIASILAPVPLIGQPYRDEAGPRLYNRSIYGGVSNDQILPVWAESELSLGLPGLLVVGLAVGMCIRRVGDKMTSARDAPSMYAWTLLALWLGQVSIVSISILVQICIYFLLPLASLIRMRTVSNVQTLEGGSVSPIGTS